MKLSAKVLVVGGGPAGAIGAKTLAEWGVEVILLERNFLFEKPCGGGIPLSAFDEFGITKGVINPNNAVQRGKPAELSQSRHFL